MVESNDSKKSSKDNKSSAKFRSRKHFNKNNNSVGGSKEKFKGKTKDLEGSVFDALRYNQADEYIKTKNEIIEYVSKTFEYGTDIKKALMTGVKPKITLPDAPKRYNSSGDEDPDGRMNETERFVWEEKVKTCLKREERLNVNLCKTYDLVWGQCSDNMREKIKSLKNFSTIELNQDVLQLLEEIRVINFKFEDQRYLFSSVYFANKRFYNYRQSADDSNNEYKEKFDNFVKVVESYGGISAMKIFFLIVMRNIKG